MKEQLIKDLHPYNTVANVSKDMTIRSMAETDCKTSGNTFSLCSR